MGTRGEAPWRRYVRLWGANVAADIDDEMQFHIELRTDELERTGMVRGAARALAEQEFGDMARAKAECLSIGEQQLRRQRRAEWWDTIGQDLRYAGRALRRNPGFTLVAVLALALGIGANAGVFAVADAAAFRPLPVRDPEGLVAIYGALADANLLNVPYPAYEMIREQRSAFDDVATFTEKPVSLQAGDEARVVWAHLTSDNYFDMLGVRALHGRAFGAGELRTPVAVLSDALWRAQFQADPSVVGRSIELNGYPYTVIGVMPAAFQGTRLFSWAPELWLPAGMYDQVVPGSTDGLQRFAGNGFTVVARLRDGMKIGALDPVLERAAEAIRAAGPDWMRSYSLTAIENRTPINPWLAPPAQMRAIARIFLGGVALVLLIACADVANLLLARMSGRRSEMAVRLSLGAARGRIVRQLLTENLVLALLAGLVALPIALGATRLMALSQPPTDHAIVFRATIDVRVLLVTALIAILTGIVAGIIPAWRGARADLGAVLRSDTGGATGRRSRLRDALVVLQIAISVVVLTAAGLFARNAQRAHAVQPGFDVENALVFTLQPRLLRDYDSTRVATLYRELLPRLRALPGVLGVTRATSLPLDGNHSLTTVFADGRAATAEDGEWTDYVDVDPGYYDVLGARIVEGREFATYDRDATPRVIINRALADRLWPGESAVGRRIRDGSPQGDAYEVIGVTETGHYQRLAGAAEPSMAFDLEQTGAASTTIVVRTAGDATAMLGDVQRVVREIDARLALVGLKTLRDHIAPSYAAAESGAFGSAVFGALALILAAAGVYGVVSYAAAQRRREIGIRMALGAARLDVLRLVMQGGARLALFGLGVGVAFAVLAGFALRGMMYDGSGHDPLTLLAVCAVLAAVALLASWLPARRAAALDPTLTMRP